MSVVKSLVFTLILVVITSGLAVGGVAVFGGLTMPMGDLNDHSDMGEHFGARMHLPIVPLVFSAGPSVIYHSLPGTLEDDNQSFIELMGSARFSLPAGPVIIGGLGWTVVDGTIQGIDADKETEFTWMVGTGASFMVLEFNALWHHLDGQDFVTVSAGVGF